MIGKNGGEECDVQMMRGTFVVNGGKQTSSLRADAARLPLKRLGWFSLR
jgi:hypothetical protein